MSGVALKVCPCGCMPRRLLVYDSSGGQSKYASVGGDCCGEWEVEFNTQHKRVGTPECYDLAVTAWNKANRGGIKDARVR